MIFNPFRTYLGVTAKTYLEYSLLSLNKNLTQCDPKQVFIVVCFESEGKSRGEGGEKEEKSEQAPPEVQTLATAIIAQFNAVSNDVSKMLQNTLIFKKPASENCKAKDDSSSETETNCGQISRQERAKGAWGNIFCIKNSNKDACNHKCHELCQTSWVSSGKEGGYLTYEPSFAD